MSFDYRKIKQKKDDSAETFWTSYSDLFTMLSVVFLMLYVVSSVRSSTSQLQKNVENKVLAQKAADLEQQIQVYNTLRDQQLKQEPQSEQEVYQKLMAKLTLLKEEAKGEKEELTKQAKENAEKEYALNEYQRLIRNIINTNILSKAQIKRRDENIKEQKQTIVQKDQELKASAEEIQELQDDIEDKQRALANNKKRIEDINENLKDKMEQLQSAREHSKITQAQLNQQLAKLKQDSTSAIHALESKNQTVLQDLQAAQQNLTEVTQLAAQEKQQSAAEKNALVSELEKTKAGYEGEMDKIKKGHSDQMAREKAAFDDMLKKERMSGMERARKIADFANALKSKEQDLQNKLGQLNGKVAEAEGRIAKAQGDLSKTQADLNKTKAQADADKGRFLANIEGLNKDKANLSKDLARVQEIANARRNLSNKIQGVLKKQGLTGSVDANTGDVTLSFGEEYFDTGSANMKDNMRKTLEKFMPGYATSLFADPKIANNIENVEIIGFASSTYKGKYVAPDSLNPTDQEAVNYNLRLSFNRANAIFKHIFDTNQMTFSYQKELLPKIKVVGRGYLPEGKSAKDFPNGIPESQFCKNYNCKSAQKVIIKFKLKD